MASKCSYNVRLLVVFSFHELVTCESSSFHIPFLMTYDLLEKCSVRREQRDIVYRSAQYFIEDFDSSIL
jgi:hypothetical protein